MTDSLDKHFKGSAYTAAWYCGISGSNPSFAAADTQGSHPGWTEGSCYAAAGRPAITWGTATTGSIDNSGSKAVFTINATDSVGGAFVTTGSAKSGSPGILYGGGAFAGGNRSVVSGDTLNVTVTCTASTA